MLNFIIFIFPIHLNTLFFSAGPRDGTYFAESRRRGFTWGKCYNYTTKLLYKQMREGPFSCMFGLLFWLYTCYIILYWQGENPLHSGKEHLYISYIYIYKTRLVFWISSLFKTALFMINETFFPLFCRLMFFFSEFLTLIK